jgi:F-box/leucine-rich repeat protein 2/20
MNIPLVIFKVFFFKSHWTFVPFVCFPFVFLWNIEIYEILRASNLRCIRLESCMRISDEGWCEVAKKFPLLEEVNISNGFQSKETLEVIGQSCPLLKSLTYYGMSFDITRDDQAFVIANTMPGLCHLDIHGNELTNVGLLAILDGCPLLESLNIEGCNNLDITVSLWQRLNSQIKHLLIWEDCPDSYDNLQLEFAYEDSDGNSYWEYVEKFDEDDDEEEEEEDDDDDDGEEEDDDDDDDEEEEDDDDSDS